MKRLHGLMVMLGLVLFGTALLPASTARAAPEVLCFPENPMITHCIASFRDYWEQNGGLQIFGYPLSTEQPERNPDTGRTHIVQWFERNRFEAHPENQPPYDVLLGRLGAQRLAQLGRNWRAEGRERGPQAGCLWFEETGHNVCDYDPNGAVPADRGFKSYWEAEGLANPRLSRYARSLALHGLPLTAARMETNSSGHTVLTQWFERGRFEWHPTNPSGARVLLGLLGNELRGSPAKQTLKFFWPPYLPDTLSVLRDGSFGSETMWIAHFARPPSRQPALTIAGGAADEAPGRKMQEVTVRGQRGTVFATGSGYVVLWTEDGQPYTVGGKYDPPELLDVIGRLEVVGRATFERRLEGVQAPQGLKYLWPGPDVRELSVWPEPHGGSWANETAFKLNLFRPHSRQPDVTIWGGTAVERPQGSGQAIRVRGQPGTVYTTGVGYSVVWAEDGQCYMITSDSGLRDVLQLAEQLEELDLQTFRQRLRPQE